MFIFIIVLSIRLRDGPSQEEGGGGAVSKLGRGPGAAQAPGGWGAGATPCWGAKPPEAEEI